MLAFLVCMGWMFWSPFSFHVGKRNLGWEHHWTMKGWSMMHGNGQNICSIEYFTVDKQGNEHPVDRYALLGYDDWTKAPKHVKRVYRKNLRNYVKANCRRVAPGVDFRLRSQCAGYDGWDEVFLGKTNICKAKGFRQSGTWRPGNG